MNEQYGITTTGFNLKRMPEILTELQADVSEVIGTDITLNAQSLLNVMLAIIADGFRVDWETAQNIYSQFSFLTADGQNLDNIASGLGILRSGGSPSYYNVRATASSETTTLNSVVLASQTSPAVNLVPIDETQNFMARSVQGATGNGAASIVFSITNAALTMGGVVVNGKSYNYSISGTTGDIALQTAALVNADTACAVSAQANGATLTLTTKIAEVNQKIDWSAAFVVTSISKNFSFKSQENGDFNLPDSTALTPVVGDILSGRIIGNYTPGSAFENDETFRDSISKKLFLVHNGRGLDSIISAVLSVSGVTAVRGTENNTNTANENGLPAHSFNVVVTGGEDYEIAAKIAQIKPCGIQAYGTTTVNVPLQYGGNLAIGFTKATNLYVWVCVQITAVTNGALTLNSAEQATTTTAIQSYIRENSAVALTGQRLVLALLTVVNRIADATITLYCDTNSKATPPVTPYSESIIIPTTTQNLTPQTANGVSYA